MAVKVKLDRGPKGKPALALADYRHPEDVRTHRNALIETLVIWLVMIGLAALLGRAFRQTLIVTAVVAGWIVLSAFHFLVIARGAPRRQEAELRKRQKRDAMARTEDAAVSKTLEEYARKAARALGANVATAALTDGPPEAQIVGKSIDFPRSLHQQLVPDEIASLIAREVGHLKAKHAYLLRLAQTVERLEPLLRYTWALPITILVERLRNWIPYAERTADRAAQVIVQNHKVCGSAIIKQAIARYGGEIEFRETEGWEADDAGEQRGVDAQELSAYLSREGELQMDAGDVSSHYRLGEFLRQHPDVRSRVAELAQFAASPEYRAAVEKVKVER